MANLRRSKQQLRKVLESDDWQAHLDEIAAGGMANVGALFSFLLLEPEMMHRAARALGKTVAAINGKEPEAARNIMRRFMWHMNEESGNIGWGIPAAFAETVSESPDLARTYARILNSYIMDLGFDDNFCDHDILRRTCYWGVGRLAQSRPEPAAKAMPWLIKGLEDRDSVCRGMAAWALGQLPDHDAAGPALEKLAQAQNNDQCAIFDGSELKEFGVSELAAAALAR